MSDIIVLLIFIKSGASFSMAITLNLAGSSINSFESTPFLSIKNVSISILFLSEEAKDTQMLPSSAS